MPILNDVQLSSPEDLVPLAKGDEPIYVVLTSSNDEETGAPWCSDVRAALPFLKETFDKPDGPKAIYESVGPRPGWVIHIVNWRVLADESTGGKSRITHTSSRGTYRLFQLSLGSNFVMEG